MAGTTISNKFLINAPAGSGKTTSIRNHLKTIYMEEPTSKVLCITYTNRAADELKKDLESANITVSTIHSYINSLISPFFAERKIIDLYWELFGAQTEARISNVSKDENIAESNAHYMEKFGGLSLDIVKAQLKELSYGETPHTSLYTGKLSHDDLLMFAYHMMCRFPVILRKISNKYNYIFIDEYQDTSAYVLKIFYLAVKEVPTVKLYLLGDRMQQIYHNYDGSFEEEFREFDTTKKLDTNYRSIGKIISILNRIYNDTNFDQNPSEKNKDIVPDITPHIIITSNPKESVSKVQTDFPNILTLYLMNREKYDEIGASNLYACYSRMESYAFGRKYTSSDVLSDLSEDNPDPLMRFLFLANNVMQLYSNQNYGQVIATCKKQSTYFKNSEFRLYQHADKKTLKEKFDKLQILYNSKEKKVRGFLDCIHEVGLVKEGLVNSFYENTEYSSVFDVNFDEIKNLAAYLNTPYLSTQHGVKGESHTSVVFVANDSNSNTNVRMHAFFEFWSTMNFSLPEFENMYYSYIRIIAEVEEKLGLKIGSLTATTHNNNDLNKKIIREYSEQVLEKFNDNKIFEAVCKNDFITYLHNPTVGNAKKIFKITQLEGILTAYKLFYVGCSRARRNLIIVIDEAKIRKFRDSFVEKATATGFDVIIANS